MCGNLIFEATDSLFSRVAVPFDIPTAHMRGPISLHLYQYLLLTVLVVFIPMEVVTVSVWFQFAFPRGLMMLRIVRADHLYWFLLLELLTYPKTFAKTFSRVCFSVLRRLF